MALKITLKPHEKIILGSAVITNGRQKCEFVVENKVPILRNDHILSADQAETPARRIYLTIQLMYVDPQNRVSHQRLYWQLMKEFVDAAPSALELIDQINEYVYREAYYKALKTAQQLIQYEQEVIERVTKCSEILPVC